MKYNYFNRILFSLVVSFLISIISSENSVAQNANASNVKFVRVDIGHGGLHCPFLGPQLEKKLKELVHVANYYVNKQESYATFEIPVSEIVTDELLRQVAIKVGYPAADVSVVISDVAPLNKN